MPQSVIIQLPGGPVPVYASRLVESLKEHGSTDVSICVGSVQPQPHPGFPKSWNPPSTGDSNWRASDFDASMGIAEDTLFVQLGPSTNQEQLPFKGHRISCSFFRDATGPCFPELVHAMLKDDGFIEVRVTSTNRTGTALAELNGFFKIIPHSYQQSFELSIEGAIGLLVKMIVSNCNGSSNLSTGSFQPKEHIPSLPLTSNTISKLRKKARLTAIRKRFQQAFTIDRWNIGIIDAPIHQVALSQNKKWDVKWLRESSGNDFRADPFGIGNPAGDHILFECMQNNRGRIHSLDENAIEKVFLKEERHLSYPYTFESEGITYVAPESSEKDGVHIYPIDPVSLQPGRPLMLYIGISAIDPSIVHHNGRWWLFCTDRTHKGADVRLHLFHANALEGPWESHPMNPIKTDIRSARPAGHLFVHEGVLYRPSQDSSSTYGGRIIINRIEQLDTECFRETSVNNLGPDNFLGPYRKGNHTISKLGNKTCIDGKRQVFNPFAFKRFFT